MRKLLYPFALLYGAITAIRNHLFDNGWFVSKVFDIPVISIGNLSVGGTGKTPVTKFISKLLQEKYRVAILSRGYGRKTKGFYQVSGSSNSNEVGDEPLLLYTSLTSTEVAVCEDRQSGIEKLLEGENPPEVILLDDAFQHRWVKPSLSILLSTFQKPFYNDLLLPAGNLRESSKEAKRAHIIVLTKAPVNLSKKEAQVIEKKIGLKEHQRLFFSSISYSSLRALPGFKEKTKDIKSHENLLVVTGIAQPAPMLDYLRQFTSQIEHFSYSDHHAYSKNDVSRIEKSAINKDKVVITEKDAVKLAPLLINSKIYDKVFVLPISIKILFDQKKQFNSLILKHVTTNK